MIGSLSGKLLQRRTYSLILDVQGVGYEVYLSEADQKTLPEPGSALFLWIHLNIKETQWSLFGFHSLQKRDLFRHLLGVNGMGPKLALACAGTLEPDDLVEIVASRSCEKLERVPGIGKKLAARLMLELNAIVKKLSNLATHSKKSASLKSASLSSEAKVGSCSLHPWVEEVVQALRQLGYREENSIRELASAIWIEEKPESLAAFLKATLQRCDIKPRKEIEED